MQNKDKLTFVFDRAILIEDSEYDEILLVDTLNSMNSAIVLNIKTDTKHYIDNDIITEKAINNVKDLDMNKNTLTFRHMTWEELNAEK